MRPGTWIGDLYFNLGDLFDEDGLIPDIFSVGIEYCHTYWTRRGYWNCCPELTIRVSAHPDPGEEQVRSDMLRLRALGYNGIKLCLWFPPSYYFNLADEMGMLLWVELPMWLPLPTGEYRGQALREYTRLVKQARQHPSVVLYTLGCELGQTVDGDFLGQLYTQTKKLTEGALVRDNSGSSEAYYGPMREHADF